jgi:hypothetical protein
MASSSGRSPKLTTTIRNSIYSITADSLSLLSYDPDYSPDQYHESGPLPTRLSQRDRRSFTQRTSRLLVNERRPASIHEDNALQKDIRGGLSDPFDDSNSLESQNKETENPFSDPSEIEAEPPYHIFSRKKKWSVIVLVGVAGLFSSLSSNTYFPALDAIAKASKLADPSSSELLTVE